MDADTLKEDISRVKDFWRSERGVAYRRFGAYWELERYIREFLEPYKFFEQSSPTEVKKLVDRMAFIIRSRVAQKAAKTRARNRKKRRLEKHSPMFPGFERDSSPEKKGTPRKNKRDSLLRYEASKNRGG
ncbi:MAG: hypothetical protein G01um101456_110 [Parcubacteria group bacterium Gr01-1014_56]|nr:MAG: hypothetical protein G01um101456_110 [Parcubacteria group bacterium Gr01-1014_56]